MDSFDALLAVVLEQECGYRQPAGGPYIRTRDGFCWDDAACSLVNPKTRAARALPDAPDGLAYDDDPHDPGGRTCMGVLQRVYDGYRKGKATPTRDVWLITDDEIRDIYWAQYFRPMRIDDLPAGVDLVVFDMGVNTGITRGARHLQEVVGATADGHIGEATIAAARTLPAADLIDRLCVRREQYYRSLHHFWRFGKGWLTRVDNVRHAAAAMTRSTPPPVPLPVADRVPVEPAPRAPTAAAPPAAVGIGTPTATVGAGGAATAAQGAAKAVEKAPADAAWWHVLINVMAEPLFWTGVLVLVGSIVAWLQLRRAD